MKKILSNFSTSTNAHAYPGQQHLFHLVTPSPWPFLTSFSALSMFIGTVMYMHSYQNGLFVAFSGVFSVLICMTIWWRDVIREATYRGDHTSVVQKGLRYGMILFIVSEACFFAAFFWAFFHSSIHPTVEIYTWPPYLTYSYDPLDLGLGNTMLLLTSGCAITASHHFLLAGKRVEALRFLRKTFSCGVFFLCVQFAEYLDNTIYPHCIADGIYTSTFYMTTGFHGFHVIIGVTMLAVMAFRMAHFQFTKQHHFGFEAAAWYWHFVDVIWLLVYAVLYVWSSWGYAQPYVEAEYYQVWSESHGEK